MKKIMRRFTEYKGLSDKAKYKWFSGIRSYEINEAPLVLDAWEVESVSLHENLIIGHVILDEFKDLFPNDLTEDEAEDIPEKCFGEPCYVKLFKVTLKSGRSHIVLGNHDEDITESFADSLEFEKFK